MANNSQVAHRWANDEAASGRLTGSHFRYEGAVLWSYGTIIGRMVQAANGSRVALLAAEDYSVTTQRHKSEARRAIGYGDHVPYFEVSETLLKYWDGSRYETDEFEKQLCDHVTWYLDQAAEQVTKAKRARVYKDSHLDQARQLIDTARRFAHTFGVDYPLPDDEGMIPCELVQQAEEAAQREAERRAEQRKARKAWEEEQRKRDAATFEAWKAGQSYYCPSSYRTDSHGSAYLRVIFKDGRQIVQTSMGAEVTFKQAERAFRFVKLCRMTGRSFAPNGHRVPVGHFELRSIDAQGNTQVGCHFFTWERIEEFAKAAGIFDLPGTDEALVAREEASH